MTRSTIRRGDCPDWQRWDACDWANVWHQRSQMAMAVFLIGPTSVKHPTGFHGSTSRVSGQECECHRHGREMRRFLLPIWLLRARDGSRHWNAMSKPQPQTRELSDRIGWWRSKVRPMLHIRQLLIYAAVSISPAFDRSSSRRWTRRPSADPTRGHTAKEFYSSTIQLLKFPKVKLALVSCWCDSTCRPLLLGRCCSPAPNSHSRSSSFELCVGVCVCVCTRVCDRQRWRRKYLII